MLPSMVVDPVLSNDESGGMLSYPHSGLNSTTNLVSGTRGMGRNATSVGGNARLAASARRNIKARPMTAGQRNSMNVHNRFASTNLS